MKRLLLNIFAILSLLLFVATVGLWVRSYWVSDWLLWSSGGCPSVSLCAKRGSFDIMRAESTPDRFEFGHEPATEGHFPMFTFRDAPGWRRLGFVYITEPDLLENFAIHLGKREIAFTEIVMPIWPLALLFAMLPLLRGYQRTFSRRRAIPGHCLKCGYDLRASKNRCPECGTPLMARTETKP